MKIKKCPYCGKRVSYTSGFASRRKGEFTCTQCGKQSKVVIDKKIYVFFAVAVAISVAIMAVWILLNLISNPWGIVLVALPLVIFMFTTPEFLKYVPLKKYKKSMEAKKAGIVYSDNLLDDVTDNFSQIQMETEVSGYEINTNVFNKIKEERNAARVQLQQENSDEADDAVTGSGDKTRSFVPVINDVSERHASSSDLPLRKIHSDSERSYERPHHYITDENERENQEEKKKSVGNRYSANRKF